MDLGGGLGHLTYSTLVHPGDDWREMRESVAAHVPAVKRRVSPDRPMGVSLRLSGAAASSLAGDREERAEFADYLRSEDLYVFTVNAFPYEADRYSSEPDDHWVEMNAVSSSGIGPEGRILPAGDRGMAPICTA